MSDPYKLSKPVTFTFDSAEGQKTETISTVTLRDVIGGDLLLVDEFGNQPMRMAMELIAALSGLTYSQVKQLPGSDIGPLAGKAFAQLPDFPEIGANA